MIVEIRKFFKENDRNGQWDDVTSKDAPYLLRVLREWLKEGLEVTPEVTRIKRRLEILNGVTPKLTKEETKHAEFFESVISLLREEGYPARIYLELRKRIRELAEEGKNEQST